MSSNLISSRRSSLFYVHVYYCVVIYRGRLPDIVLVAAIGTVAVLLVDHVTYLLGVEAHEDEGSGSLPITPPARGKRRLADILRGGGS